MKFSFGCLGAVLAPVVVMAANESEQQQPLAASATVAASASTVLRDNSLNSSRPKDHLRATASSASSSSKVTGTPIHKHLTHRVAVRHSPNQLRNIADEVGSDGMVNEEVAGTTKTATAPTTDTTTDTTTTTNTIDSTEGSIVNDHDCNDDELVSRTFDDDDQHHQHRHEKDKDCNANDHDDNDNDNDNDNFMVGVMKGMAATTAVSSSSSLSSMTTTHTDKNDGCERTQKESFLLLLVPYSSLPGTKENKCEDNNNNC